MQIYRYTLKRPLDFIVAAVTAVLLSPVLIAVAVLVRTFLGSPIIFRQMRPGRGGQPFELMKFRTMRDARDTSGALLPDGERLTRFGSFLRRTSLDELPELWNVIRGEMSLIGPRPLLMEYLPLYTREQFRRHDVLPGITGLAQVSGRNELPFSDRFVLDTQYVDQLSFVLDLRILVKTLLQVLRRKGITQEGHATVERFDGR